MLPSIVVATRILMWVALPVTAAAQQPAGSAAALFSPQLDAFTCAALATVSTAALQKFSLGRASCGAAGTAGALPAAAVPAVAPATAPRSQHAQQLYLYPDPEPEAGDAASAVKAPPAAASAAPSALRTRLKSVLPARVTARAKPLPQSLQRAVYWAPQVDRVAQDNALDPLLLHAIARIESRHDPLATSHAGARGMMQVMPGTARRFGVADAVALHDAPTNLEVSARYLKTLQKRFPGDLRLVLAAYNAGEGAVERYGRTVPPFAETQAYVAKVLQEYTRLSSAAASLRTGVLQ